MFQDNRRNFKKECRAYMTVEEIEKACVKYDGTTLLGDRGYTTLKVLNEL